MPEDANVATIQIGDLLVRSGIISAELLEEVNRLAFKMRLPIGRILTMHGHVTDVLLSSALEAQARIKDRALPVEHAVRALGMVAKEGLSLDEALSKMASKTKHVQRAVPTENRLGEILMQSGYATPKQVEEGLIAVAETGMPLGMVLYSKGIISRTGLNSALAAQKIIRLGGADRDKVIYALKTARLRAISLSQSLKENNINPELVHHEFGVGELLVLAGAISESQLMSCREFEVVDGRRLEDVIVENGFASLMCVQASAQLLRMVQEGVLFENQAAQIVKKTQFAQKQEAFNQALHEVTDVAEGDEGEQQKFEVTDILRKCGLLSEKELQIATSLALANRQPLLKTLFDAKLVEQRAVEMATLCKTYLDHNLIQIEQATIAIDYALENNLTIDETLDCFGWSAPCD
jgi:hypothetical protein